MIEKYASHAIIDSVGSGKESKVKGAVKSALSMTFGKGDADANWEAWRDWEVKLVDDESGVFLVAVRLYVNACYCLNLVIIFEVCASIFSAKDF